MIMNVNIDKVHVHIILSNLGILFFFLLKSVINELTQATEAVKSKIGKSIDQWAHPDRCE